MNEESNLSKWAGRMGKGLTELLFYMPVWLTLAVYWVPEEIILLWMAFLLALYVASTAISERWPNMRVITRWLISLSIVAASGAALGLVSGAAADYKFWIASIICGIWVVEQGFALIRRGWGDSFRSAHMGFGILTYAVCIPLSYGFLRELADFRLWIAACGIASVVLFLHIVNDRHLSSETVDGARSRTLSEAQRRNRLMLVGLTVLMIVFAAFRQIQQWIENNILAGLKKLFAWLGSGEKEEAPSDQPPPPDAPDMLPPMEPSEPSPLLIWLEQIMRVIVTIAVVIAALFLLWWLGRKFAAWFRQWMDKLLQRQSSRGKDDSAYTDEVESLMTLNKWRTRFRDKLKSRRSNANESEPDWDELTSGKERMRWLYRQWLRAGINQGYVPQPHLTPQETADSLAAWKGSEASRPDAASFISGYEAVRYGEADMNEEQLANHRRWVEQQTASKRTPSGKRD